MIFLLLVANLILYVEITLLNRDVFICSL